MLNLKSCLEIQSPSQRAVAHPSHSLIQEPGPGPSERRPALHAVWSSRAAGAGGVGCLLRLEYAVLNILKCLPDHAKI